MQRGIGLETWLQDYLVRVGVRKHEALAALRKETAALLSSTGTIVYLRARAETLLARVGRADERPLLAGRNPDERLARLRELLAQREAAYSRARVRVDTDERALDDVVEAIVGELEGNQ